MSILSVKLNHDTFLVHQEWQVQDQAMGGANAPQRHHMEKVSSPGDEIRKVLLCCSHNTKREPKLLLSINMVAALMPVWGH